MGKKKEEKELFQCMGEIPIWEIFPEKMNLSPMDKAGQIDHK
jgi:hypothetical protein